MTTPKFMRGIQSLHGSTRGKLRRGRREGSGEVVPVGGVRRVQDSNL